MLVINPQNNEIEFKLKLENASISETEARLLVEIGDSNLNIPLEVTQEGLCKGTIPLHESWEDKQGFISLEIIAKNTYFKPFSQEVKFQGIRKLTPRVVEASLISTSKPPIVEDREQSVDTPNIQSVESIQPNKEQKEAHHKTQEVPSETIKKKDMLEALESKIESIADRIQYTPNKTQTNSTRSGLLKILETKKNKNVVPPTTKKQASISIHTETQDTKPTTNKKQTTAVKDKPRPTKKASEVIIFEKAKQLKKPANIEKQPNVLKESKTPKSTINSEIEDFFKTKY